jgi:uncharacterized protein YdeI (YjbR/CyaY-like superfamily)
MKPRFFATPAAFGEWLREHHDTEEVLLVGFRKVGSGKPSITWPQSVDEALCWGWIDGVRKRIDDESYTIRFTPRRPGSIWSAVNIRRAEALVREGRMQPAGAKAFEAKREERFGIYSYEQRPKELVEPYAGMLTSNAKARAFFESQTPSYRRTATWWVVSAKKEETRTARAKQLVSLCAKSQMIPGFVRKPTPKAKKK